MQISLSTTTRSSTWYIHSGKSGVFRTPQKSIVFQSRIFCAKGSHDLPSRTCKLDWTFPEPNNPCESDFEGKVPYERWSSLRITSSNIWKTTSRCRHQKKRRTGLTRLPFSDRKPQLKWIVILKIDFENAFNSIKKFMLEKIFEIHPNVYKDTVSQVLFFLRWFSNQTCGETEHRDPESPAFASDSTQHFFDNLELKIHLWYLHGGILRDYNKIVLKDLKKLLKLKKRWKKKDPQKNSQKVNFFIGEITEIWRLTILASLQLICPGSIHLRKRKLLFLVHRSARNRRQTYKEFWTRKIRVIVETLDASWLFLSWNLLQSVNVVLLLENQYMI